MRAPEGKARVWDVLAAGLWSLTLIVLAYYVLIGLQPSSPLNPFPPPTRVSLAPGPPPRSTAPAPSPQATVKPSPSPAVVVSVELASPTSTSAPPPTLEPTPTRLTPSPPGGGPTRLPSVTPGPTRSPYTFTAVINYQVHPMLTCDWTGVAGTVLDLKGQAARGYVVQAIGADRTMRQVAVGTSPDYGPGGWELRLGGRQAQGVWRIQLYAAADLKKPVSEAYEIVFQGVCQKNLAFVRFQQNH